MAQVNGFNFQSTPQNLAAINNVRPDYMPDVWDWQQRAQQHDSTGLADVMRAAQQEAAMDPGRIQKQAADLESVMAQTAGTKLDNTKKGMDNDVRAYNLPQEKLVAAKEMLLKGTEADEKLFGIEVDKLLRSDDPKKQAYGKQLLDVSRKAVEERRAAELQRGTNKERITLEGDQRMREIGAQGVNAERVAQIGADSRIKIQDMKEKTKAQAVGILDAVKSGKLTYEKGATSFFVLSQMAEDDDPNKAKYATMAAALEKAALAEAAGRAKPQADLDALGIPTTTPAVTPALGGTAAPAVADRPARQAATQRITIYKDGKAIGTVPAEQKDQAIKEGYTVK